MLSRLYGFANKRIKDLLSKLVLTDYIIVLSAVLLMLIILLVIAFSPKPDIVTSHEFDQVKSRGVLRAGVRKNVVGLSYSNGKIDEVFGLEPDICRAVAIRLFGSESVEFVEVSNSSKTAKLSMDYIDVCAAEFVTDSSSEFAYSKPYYVDRVVALTYKNSIASLPDLKDCPVGIIDRPGARDVVKKWSDSKKANLTMNRYRGIADAVEALKLGNIKAFFLENSLAQSYLASDITMLVESPGNVSYSIAVKKASPDMLKLVNEVIESLESSGAMDQLKQTWGLAEP